MKRLLFLLALVAFSSCVRDTSMDSGETPVVVVECVLTESSPQTLRLSFGKAPSASVAPTLQNAEARLYDQTDGIEAGYFERGEDDEWTLDYAAVPEHSYRLEVRVPGYELIWAEQTMPEELSVRTVPFGSAAIHLELEYYDETLAGSDVILTDSIPEHGWIYALNYNPQTGKREIVEELCTDYPYVDNYNLTGKTFDPPYELFDQYNKGVSEYLYRNPYLEGYSLHRRYLRIPRQKVKYPFSVGGGLEGQYWWKWYTEPSDTLGLVMYMSVSDDYDKYFTEAQKFISVYGSSDLTLAWQRDNIFTNIHNGVGIFGASVQKPIRYINHHYPKKKENPDNL